MTTNTTRTPNKEDDKDKNTLHHHHNLDTNRKEQHIHSNNTHK